MRARLVRFKNGKYGVRYGWIFHTFQDFRHPSFTWTQYSEHMRDCMADENTARLCLDLTKYGVVE